MGHTLCAFGLLCLGLLVSKDALAADEAERTQRMRNFAQQWLGTPYLWGGEDRDGIDCSGYVRHMFRDLFGVHLPRTTQQQIQLGVALPIRSGSLEQDLHAGDLIFYIDRSGEPKHVVAYMGNGWVTQSMGGRGVVIDPLRILWGRRIVVRRPSIFRRTGDMAIAAQGPIEPREIPCPRSVFVPSELLQSLRQNRLRDASVLAALDVCTLQVLKTALLTGLSHAGKGASLVQANIAQIEAQASWLEGIDDLRDRMQSSE